ncbi:endoplasmic reticulum-based factor for assembly of V-ATPase-domain-containing protein [Podospora appendiculata]|uniref:Endoplasmic reticulum-based factor for assembly of V-ATPase-domain-containing protein n=1 Tax=Podospora appendiculata TaxID=314037 RepID=A0AAE0XBX8_9PEZI|nr:endoplasmic reticulum-based factor for assembly of V-ATPase-domain-containing protein [Podospora appendiculata]
MVLLTMTPSIVDGLQAARVSEKPHRQQLQTPQNSDGDPSLDCARIGNPISHHQIVHLLTRLKSEGRAEFSLEKLLKGSKVYVPPPPPKTEPSSEYKALMARLRRQEEQRAYERMTNPTQPMETFSQLFPGCANMAHSFAAANRPDRDEDVGGDDVTNDDVHRQLMLIFNIMVSIIGVAVTLWVLARWWSTPARLFLTMGGSLLVGVAEVALYSGYVWHLGEAKKKDKSFREVKEVVNTWVVGAGANDGSWSRDELVAVDGDRQTSAEKIHLRRRHKEAPHALNQGSNS